MDTVLELTVRTAKKSKIVCSRVKCSRVTVCVREDEVNWLWAVARLEEDQYRPLVVDLPADVVVGGARVRNLIYELRVRSATKLDRGFPEALSITQVL